ncbi:(2Fe-2S)-binding protein [Mangrovicoccus sp. HB161399]|uniref:(2Fe-2S)-binding protein n=1 Tax=Mangrovicoccus sp. HB161399 TaxID=2720392 RepID=UPI00155636D5|nr:(2Fe-2S)-binding protein [Mangrovicoccus sp. HB161399]
MFRPTDTAAAAAVEFTWEGRALAGREGDTVAAALLGAGIAATRAHPLDGAPRGPYCLMGTCFECLVEIDGRPNRQACQVRLAPGMQVARQRGVRP